MIHRTEIDKINNEYFEWMYHLVCNNNMKRGTISFRKLLYFLHSTTFVPNIDLDDNRRIDGIDFRYRFGYENGYPDLYIDEYLNTRDCSVLEMMIALAFRVENEITANYKFGDRTGQWFWSMIVSLGLNSMEDKSFDLQYCISVIDKFMNHKYEYNGKGGLFTLENPNADMRDVDIWCQCMWYLDENLKEEIEW